MPTYLDINLNLGIHPSTKDVLKIQDVQAAKFSLRHLLLTAPGEIPDNPHYGCGLSLLMFELMTPALVALIKRTITEQVKYYLPEISLEDVSVQGSMDTGELTIIITFFVVGNPNLLTFNLTLERSR